VTASAQPAPRPFRRRIDEKLELLTRAAHNLEQLTRARALPAGERRLQFSYHFCAYIGFAGALRQYVQDELKATGKLAKPPDAAAAAWFDDFNDHVDIATMIGLRNTDVHDVSVRATRVKFEITFQATTGVGVAARIRYKHFDWQRAHAEAFISDLIRHIRPPKPLPPAKPPDEKFAARYHLDPKDLGSEFMLAVKAYPVWWTPTRAPGRRYAVGDPLVQRQPVLDRIDNTDLVAIVTSAHEQILARIADARKSSVLS
jgi:hypothetical protein